MAKLVYSEECGCLDRQLDSLIAFHNLRRLDNVSDMEILRKATANDVFVVTDPKLMRGFDYRTSDRSGIALLLCHGFPTQRSLYQGLGRVGRFGDPCKRFVLKGIELVNS